MNILKEKIKLSVAYPRWRGLLRKMKQEKKKKIVLIGTPMHGNLGDHAIAVQEQFFFHDYFGEYEYYEILMPMYHTQKQKLRNMISEDDVVVVPGGGWMGNLWLHNEKVIREIVRDYPNNKVIILPQTIYYTDDQDGKTECEITKEIFKKHKKLKVFVRDRQSYDLFNANFEFMGQSGVYLEPDMVLYGKGMPEYAEEKKKNGVINLCIRQDCESLCGDFDSFEEAMKKKYKIKEVSTVVKSPVILKNRERELQQSWKCFQEAELTITDRLHAMLFSVLNGTPCIALDNKTGKVFGVAAWIENTGMVEKVNSLDEVFVKLKEKEVWQHKKYDREYLQSYFGEMAEEIRKD